jgi:hypothetical protein
MRFLKALNAAHARIISGVMVHGRWLPRIDLQRRIEMVRERQGNYRVPETAR